MARQSLARQKKAGRRIEVSALTVASSLPSEEHVFRIMRQSEKSSRPLKRYSVLRAEAGRFTQLAEHLLGRFLPRAFLGESLRLRSEEHTSELQSLRHL